MAMKRSELQAATATDTRDIAHTPPAARLRERKKVRGFRMTDSEWSRLVSLLDRRGLSAASGLRMIVTEWMERAEREGLR